MMIETFINWLLPLLETLCARFSSNLRSPEQGHMVETCCAEKSQQIKTFFVVWREVMENKEPRMIVHPFTLLENKLPTNEKLEISLSLSSLL